MNYHGREETMYNLMVANPLAGFFYDQYRLGNKSSYRWDSYFSCVGVKRARERNINQLRDEGLDTTIELYKLLEPKYLKDISSDRVIAKESARRTQEKFDASSKSLKLDMFSYALFEKHLGSKKIPSTEAIRYLDILPVALSEKDLEVVANYKMLLWNSVKVPSRGLIEALRNTISIHSVDSHLPFTIVSSQSQLESREWCNEVGFSYHFIVTAAHKLGIPLRVKTHYITESMVSTYITSVPKKGCMNRADAIYVLDVIKVLLALKENDTYNCPYYAKTTEQLTTELNREDNKQTLEEALRESGTDARASQLLHTHLNLSIK
jgi:hypothetical protein